MQCIPKIFVLQLPFPPTTSFNISLFILTRKADCFLLQSAPSGKENNDSSQITLALSSGYLQVFVDEEIYLFTSLPVISDGKYHFIDVKIANGDLQTMVDHRRYVSKFTFINILLILIL